VGEGVGRKRQNTIIYGIRGLKLLKKKTWYFNVPLFAWNYVPCDGDEHRRRK